MPNLRYVYVSNHIYYYIVYISLLKLTLEEVRNLSGYYALYKQFTKNSFFYYLFQEKMVRAAQTYFLIILSAGDSLPYNTYKSYLSTI